MSAAPAVRVAVPADLPALAALEAAGLDEPWSETHLAEELALAGALVLVAEAEGRVVGFASFRWAADQGELLRLAVAPRRRRRGIGRALVAEGARRLRQAGVGAIFLEVREDNLEAIAFYDLCGWQRCGARRRYYRDGVDALLLRLPE